MLCEQFLIAVVKVTARVQILGEYLSGRYLLNHFYTTVIHCQHLLLFWQQLDRSALLFRQYIKYSLYDRMSTRPFLNSMEKRWIAFQLLCALNQCHKLKVGGLVPLLVLVLGACFCFVYPGGGDDGDGGGGCNDGGNDDDDDGDGSNTINNE